ncbi:MAG: O-antigen ligase family protein [Clostridia bacterium]|nr:O-antigen ligase family protein [Clostridia bacterium]
MNNSYIISYINKIVYWLLEAYRESMGHKVMERFSVRLKEHFAGSRIWNFIKSYESTSRYFEQSIVFMTVQGGIDWLLGLLRKGAAAAEIPFKSCIAARLLQFSFFGKLMKFIWENIVIILCFFIFVHTVVPYHNWHNQYGAALITLIALIYLAKASFDVRYRPDIKKLDFALILFVFSIILAALTSITPSSSIKTLVFNGMSFLLVLVMVNVIKCREDIGAIIHSIMLSILVACFIGFWQYIKGVEVDPVLVDLTFGAVGRVFSTMGNPNNYAEYLILTIPFFVAAFLNARNLYLKLAVAGAAVLAVINLVLTSSRSSWIGFAVAVLVFIFFKNRKLIPLVLLLGILAIPLLPVSITSRLATIGKDSSSLYRLSIWEGALRMLGDYWPTGAGLGPEPFMKLFNRYSAEKRPAHSHLLPLQVWLELGIVGIASLVWLIVRLIKKGAWCIAVGRDAYLNNVIIACISSIAGIFVIGLFEYVWFYPRILTMFWIDIAIFMAALNLQHIKTALPVSRG